jgi:hypothetical protein
MEQTYHAVADSTVLLGLVMIPIIFVLIQALLFARLAIRRMRELGLGGHVKKIIANSAIFSVIPSLPIVITMAALMVVLGKFLPWLRLSVIGSAMYETMCADMTIKGMGFGAGLGTPDYPANIFGAIIWVMTAVALAWPLCNLIALRFYDRKLKTLKQGGAGFMKYATGALFVGLMCYFSVPVFFNFKNPTGIVVSIVSGGSVLLYDYLAKKTNLKLLSDFAFPLAMVTGMASAIIFTQLTGGAV